MDPESAADVAAADQDGPSPDSPALAAEGSPPDAPVAAGSGDEDDLADAPPDAADSDEPEGVFLTRAELAHLESFKSRERDIARREAEAERKEAEAERKGHVAWATGEAERNIKLWEDYGEENGFTPDVRQNIRKWERWLAGEHLRVKDAELHEARAVAVHAAIPDQVANIAKELGITEKDDLAELLTIAKSDPRQLEVAARMMARQNRKEAERREKQRRANATKRTQATKDHLDTVSADRRARQADTLGGGNGAASFDLPFKLGSDEHIIARLPHLFGPKARGGR